MPSYQQSGTSPSSHVNGMTLIEAMSVLSIVAITLGMAAPSLNSLRQQWRHDTQEIAVQSFLRQSRSAAVSSMQNVIVCGMRPVHKCSPDRNWSGGLLSFVDTNGNNALDASDKVLRILDLEESSLMSAKTFLQYNPMGGGDMGRLDLCTSLPNGFRLSRIFISLSGRHRLETQTAPEGYCPS